MLVGCGGNSAPVHHSGLPQIRLSSPAFVAGARIPARYTCEGADVSMPLHWSGVPAKASSLTLTVIDHDAPGGNFIHWQVQGIPASTTTIDAGQVPPGVTQGVNGFGSKGYRGPCPPRGDPRTTT